MSCRPFHVAIIGCGPWGLAVLERLHAAATLSSDALQLVVHVIEPGCPGVGIYCDQLPEYLLLNTACGQVDSFASKILNPGLDVGFARPSFHDWLRSEGYRVRHYRRPDGTEESREVRGGDFLPRRWLGHYLRMVFATLSQNLPPNLELRVHARRAVDVTEVPLGERVSLDDGTHLTVNHVFLTLGHGEAPAAQSELREVTPVGTRGAPELAPGAPVGLAGFGLTSIDAITHVTVGRGGAFLQTERGLEYVPSGREPTLLQFSRGGTPYKTRPEGSAEMGRRAASRIFDAEALRHVTKARGRLDFRADILPLILDEMSACFDHVSRAAPTARGAPFDAARELFEQAPELTDADSYERSVADLVVNDIRESRHGTGRSAKKAGLESLRDLRELVRALADFGGLTPASFHDFRRNFVGNVYRLIVGPPVQKMEEWLALRRAGIVRTPVGPAPQVQRRAGHWSIESSRLQRGVVVQAERLLSGHASPAHAVIRDSTLLGNLVASGRVRPLDPSGALGCGLDLDSSFHPRGAAGTARRLFVLGLLTEGARSFNLYVPSPGSRLRAFTDAQACVDELGATARDAT